LNPSPKLPAVRVRKLFWLSVIFDFDGTVFLDDRIFFRILRRSEFWLAVGILVGGRNFGWRAEFDFSMTADSMAEFGLAEMVFGMIADPMAEFDGRILNEGYPRAESWRAEFDFTSIF
jgi:hypothetical protein